jgi:hypothetical protein
MLTNFLQESLSSKYCTYKIVKAASAAFFYSIFFNLLAFPT